MLKNDSLPQPAPAAEMDIPGDADEDFIESGVLDAADLSDNETGLFLIGTPTVGSANRGTSL
uniref:Uncharacterized protein n=1 Tax=Arundo donax TaxID=35708 RepID=A0A0A9CB36_ARUDO